MEKSFMISIQFKGRTVFANVFEYRHSPAQYHVYFIDHVEPNKMTLHEEDGQIVVDASENQDPMLVKMVVKAIEENPNRI